MYTFTRKFWKTQFIKMRNEVGGEGVVVDGVSEVSDTGEKKKKCRKVGMGNILRQEPGWSRS